MRSLEIANLPDGMYQRIEEQAAAHGTTVSQEAAELLAKALADDDTRETELLAELAAGRAELKAKGIPSISETEIQDMKQWGRE